MEHPLKKAIPAATVIIFNDAPEGGTPQLLMVRRADSMAFAAGAAVFPGGRVDADDHYLAKIFATNFAEDDGAARIAAIRETLEETGLSIAIGHGGDAEAVAAARKELLGGGVFSQILNERGWALQPDQLVPFARWRPSHLRERIFDTRFYLARNMDSGAEITADATENSHALWIEAQSMLDLADLGSEHIIFPTRRNLERLAQFTDFAEAVNHAKRHEVKVITPYFEDRDGDQHLCIATGFGYPITSESVRTMKRG